MGSGPVSLVKVPGGWEGGNGARDDGGEQRSQLVRPRARKLPNARGGQPGDFWPVPPESELRGQSGGPERGDTLHTF